mmetsp:Transcript_4478/g.9813  ORF Transcript_4478/g.9813 Transcript_4478/m.9813 type:complete len:507 (+) Transcript_4478:365-1885(+)
MASIKSFLRSEVRVPRILFIAIIVVSSSQFFIGHNTLISTNKNQEHAAAVHQSFFNGNPTKNGRRIASQSSSGKNTTNKLNNKPSANTAANNAMNNTKNIEFCGTCYHDLTYTCNERLKYIMSKYKMTELEAKQDLMSTCGVDYSTEPFVLIHAGPHKTGTTSIQSFIYHSLWQNKTFLREDNYAVPDAEILPGIFGDVGPGLNLAHCMLSDYRKDGGQMNVAFCNKLRFGPLPHWLEDNYNKSRNIIIVAEDFDRRTINQRRLQYYLRPYKRLRVVVGYRRQHDWLPSWYNQIVDLYTTQYIRGEAKYPSFVEWIDKRYEEFRQVHAIEVATRFRNSGKFESVDILNMHDDVGLMENLFCNYVPGATATCKVIKDGANPAKPNIGRAHEYERLATMAYLHGKLPKYHSAIAAMAEQIKNMAVERGIFKDGDDYPKICLNQTFLDGLLQTEMEQEREYFPEWYERQGGDEGLKKAFEKSKYKLCSMDVEKVWRSKEFFPIFAELSK